MRSNIPLTWNSTACDVCAHEGPANRRAMLNDRRAGFLCPQCLAAKEAGRRYLRLAAVARRGSERGACSEALAAAITSAA